MVHTMTAHNLLRQAETLKASAAETSKGSVEAWTCRQSLQDLYQKLLIVDLEYALDKKVEQDLWNHAFKNQITMFQSQAKDRNNPKRPEIQATLNLFLDTASGFYLQLLQEICSAFRLDLPMRKKALRYGILSEFKTGSYKMKLPKKSSCLYICQYCLVHLGDIARYRQQVEQAQTYYRHAVNVVPYNGQPYNQLAILEAARANKLTTVFYYVRSIAVKHPFPVASLNLEKFYNKISNNQNEYKSKLSVSEMVSGFLQFHALLHHCIDIEAAQILSEKLAANLGTHIMSISFSSYQLLQMVTINLFGLYHAKRRLDTATANQEEGDIAGMELSNDEQRSYDVILEFTMNMFDVMLQSTPKQEVKAKEYHTLPVLKIILDWILSETDLLTHACFKRLTQIWPNLAKTLNTLQFVQQGKTGSPPNLSQYYKLPLPEDNDLQCFLPLSKAYSELQFQRLTLEGLPDNTEVMLRCQRVVEHGLVLAEDFPSLNLLNVKKFKSGRLEFSAPTPHVKVMPGDTDGGVERRPVRTNVAIQAIIQSKLKKSNSDPSPHAKRTIEQKLNKTMDDKTSKTADASVTAHQVNSLVPLQDDNRVPSTTDREQQLANNENPLPQSISTNNMPISIIHDSDKPTSPSQPKKKVGFQLDEDKDIIERTKPVEITTTNRIKQLWEPNPGSKSQSNVKQSSGSNFKADLPPRFANRDPWNKSRLQNKQASLDSALDRRDNPQIQRDHFQMPFAESAFGPFGLRPEEAVQMENQRSFDDDKNPYGNFGSGRLIEDSANPQNEQYGLGSGWPNAPMMGSSPGGEMSVELRRMEPNGSTLWPNLNTPEAPGLWNVHQQRDSTNWQQRPNAQDSTAVLPGQTASNNYPHGQNPPTSSQEALNRLNANQHAQLGLAHANQMQTKPHGIGPSANQLPFPLFEQTAGRQGWGDIRPPMMPENTFPNVHPTLRNLFEAAHRPGIPREHIMVNSALAPQPPSAQAFPNRAPIQNQPAMRGNPQTHQIPVFPANQMPRMLAQQMQGLASDHQRFVAPNQHLRMTANQNQSLAANQMPGVPFVGNRSNQSEPNPRDQFAGVLEKHKFGIEQFDSSKPSEPFTVGSPYNRKIAPSTLLSPPFSTGSTGLDVGFPFLVKEIAKADSPRSEVGSLFSTPDKNSYGTPSSGTYSLFSQSPWNTPLNKSDTHSHNSSPFNSTSNRTSPDYFALDERSPKVPTGINLGYNVGTTEGGWAANVTTNQNLANQNTAPVLTQNQGLWAAGPSPLEKLLERQRLQKNDPH